MLVLNLYHNKNDAMLFYINASVVEFFTHFCFPNQMDHIKSQGPVRIHKIVGRKRASEWKRSNRWRLRTLQLDPVGVSATQDLAKSNVYRTKLYTWAGGPKLIRCFTFSLYSLSLSCPFRLCNHLLAVPFLINHAYFWNYLITMI